MGRGVLTLAALWIALSIIAVGMGFALLGGVSAQLPERAGDVIFFAFWIGIATLAWVSFALVNFVPLRVTMPWIGIASILAAVCGILRCRSTWRALGRRVWIAFIVLALVLAERSVTVGPLEDTGGYHWSIVSWYEAFGIPVGLGLFQWRLATHSSWLALTALLDIGVLEGRTVNVANGLLFLACIGFAGLCALRWVRGSAALSDRFALAALAFLLQLIAKWDMRLSTSPDIPVLLVTIVVCWRLLKDAEAGPIAESTTPSLAMIAAIAVTMKLSALPLAVVCTVLLWTSRAVALRICLAITACLGVIVLPLLLASWTTTGCLLFPLPVGCVETSTAVGAAAARQYAAIIGSTARNDIGASLVATGIAAAYLAWKHRELPLHRLIGPIAVALAGIMYTAFIAPTARFAIAYLTIIPALAIAHAAGDGALIKVTARQLSMLRASVVAALLLAIATPLYKEFIYASLRARHFDTWAERKRGDPTINEPNSRWWLIPNRIDYRGPFETARAIDFDYTVSPQMTCWSHPQPCASNPTLSALPDIRLRDPTRGLASGFERAH
jgi:hypothetical protein